MIKNYDVVVISKVLNIEVVCSYDLFDAREILNYCKDWNNVLAYIDKEFTYKVAEYKL